MGPELMLIEKFGEQLIQQVPALVIMAWIVWLYLKHAAQRDDQFLSTLKELRQELHSITDHFEKMCDKIAESQSSVCHFHDQFQASLQRIEAKVNNAN